MLSGVRWHGLRRLVWRNDSPKDSPSLYYNLSSSLRCSPVSLGTCSPRKGQAAPLEKLTRRRFRGVQSIYTSLISGTTRGRGDDSHVVAGIMGACRAWNLRRLWSLTTTPQFCVSLSLC